MLKRLLDKVKALTASSNVSLGFTLIELLIVIVIIGILAGVLIAVIDPTAQQNRARDANLRAAVNKIALATSGYVAAYARIPDEIEFQTGINGFTNSNESATCSAASTADCRFWLSAMATNSTCATAVNAWSGSGTDQCNMVYCGTDNAQASGACGWSASEGFYRIIAKAYGSANVFMYRSSDSRMYLCDASGGSCAAL